MTDRPDDLDAMRRITNKFYKKRALIILGGPSAAKWEELAGRINPHVLIGVNGVNSAIPYLDLWLCSENMTYPQGMADKGEQRYIDIMTMFNRVGAGVRLVNYKSWP